MYEDYIRPRQGYYSPNHQSDDDKLCSKCASIDLESLFSNGLDHEICDGVPIREGVPIGYSDEIYSRVNCPFCRLLVELGDNNIPEFEREVEFWSITTVKGHEVLSPVAEPLYEVKIENSSTAVESLLDEAIYLALVRTIRPPPRYGYEYRTVFKNTSYIGVLESDDLKPPRDFSLRPTADGRLMVNRLRGWIARCRNHKGCQPTKTRDSALPDGFRLFEISSLRVVDSNGDEPYVALTYPWVQMDKFEIKRDEAYIPKALPSLLRDMIDVVQELGLDINHIWFDRLCIDQANSVQKQVNIDAMGDIYEAASATIILAVPSQGSPEPGLRGLSAKRMPWQCVEKVGRMRLATTLPSLEMTILTSKWNSRAWTFQEGLLSRRCIIFSQEQAYFECAEMACCESIREPKIEKSEDDHLIPYRSRHRNPFLDSYDFDSLYWRLVRDNTSRDMRYISDSLNAFSAFVQEFKRTGTTLQWGMPTALLSQHLLWEHEPWDSRDISRRRDCPSWSWAGWHGTAAMHFPFKKISYSCTAIAESPGSAVLRCNARVARLSLNGMHPHISAAGDPESSLILDIGLNAAPSILAEAYMMEVCRLESKVHGLLVEPKGEYHERIGSGFVKFSTFEAARPEWKDVRMF